MRETVIARVHDAAVALLRAMVLRGEVTIPVLATLSGLSVRGVRGVLNGPRATGPRGLSTLVAAAGVSRERVWIEAGVTPYSVPRMFLGPYRGDVSYHLKDLRLPHCPLPVGLLLWPPSWGSRPSVKNR